MNHKTTENNYNSTAMIIIKLQKVSPAFFNIKAMKNLLIRTVLLTLNNSNSHSNSHSTNNIILASISNSTSTSTRSRITSLNTKGIIIKEDSHIPMVHLSLRCRLSQECMTTKISRRMSTKCQISHLNNFNQVSLIKVRIIKILRDDSTVEKALLHSRCLWMISGGRDSSSR